MMNSWNSVIFMRSNKDAKALAAMAKWEEVDRMWSTSGEWDWCVQLKPKNSSPEMTETVVNRMRDGQWANETKTQWWRQVER